MSRTAAVCLAIRASRLTQSGEIMAFMNRGRIQDTFTVSRHVPATDPHCLPRTRRKSEAKAHATRQGGCLNGHAAIIGTSWADRLRRAAATLLLLGLAVFALQATVQPAVAGHMIHAGQTAAAANQACAHSHATRDKALQSATETSRSNDSGSSVPHDDCVQLCTFVAVLPAAFSIEPSWENDVGTPVWSHRAGRASGRILRPPRLSAPL